MKLISAISNIEKQKQIELNEEIDRLENEIENKKNELKQLLAEGKKQIEEELKIEEEQKLNELKKLENEIKQKSYILNQLKEKEKELQGYENEIVKIQNRLAKLNNRIENYIIRGMTYNDVCTVLEIKKISIIYVNTYPTLYSTAPWIENFGSGYISWHGRYALIWSSSTYDNPVILGWFDSNTGKCYYRNP